MEHPADENLCALKNKTEFSKSTDRNETSNLKSEKTIEVHCLNNENPAGLNNDDYTAIIKKASGEQHELIEVKWDNIPGLTVNIRSLKIKIKTADGEKSLSYIAKIFNDNNHKDIFEKELLVHEFIEKIRNDVSGTHADVTPRMVHYGNEVIILEDIREAGYEILDCKYFDRMHMLKALEALARFHALSIIYEERMGNELGRVYQMSDDYSKMLKSRYRKEDDSAEYSYIKAGLIGASALIDLGYKSNLQRQFWKLKIDQMFHEFLDLLNEPNDYRKVLSHAGVFNNHLLFKHDSNGNPIDCKITNLQSCQYTPPAYDVSMLIYTTSERKLYHSHIHEYYEHYYRNLSSELKIQNLDIIKILPIDEFQVTCKIFTPLSKLIWMFYSETMQASDDLNLKIANDPDYSSNAIFGDGRADFVKENYTTNPAYRSCMDHLLEDFRLTHVFERITLEDCCTVMTRKLNGEPFEITNYTVDTIELKSGYLGDYCELKITVKAKTTSKHEFFVKLLPDGKCHKKEFLSKSGAGFKELNFFSKIITDFQAHGICTDFTPTAYLFQPGLLIMDDLKPLGYTLANIRESLEFDQVKLGLDAIAKLHAAGIILEEVLGKSVRLNAIYPSELKEALYMEDPSSSDWLKAAKLGAKEQARMYSNHTSVITLDDFLDFIENIFNNYNQLVKPSDQYRNTITHGDIWTNNLMYTTNDCKLIDFQFYRYSPPARDFMQFIHVTTDRAFRSKYMQDCKEYYHKKLESLLKVHNLNISDILEYTAFLGSCEEEKAFTLSQTVIYFQHLMATPERAQEKLFDDVEYFEKAFLCDRSEFVRSTAELDPVYKKRNQEAMKDFREFCEGILEKRCSLPLGFKEKYVEFICGNL